MFWIVILKEIVIVKIAHSVVWITRLTGGKRGNYYIIIEPGPLALDSRDRNVFFF